jgi:glycosyltransferase 2 family protein
VSRPSGTSSSTVSIPETEELLSAVFTPEAADSRWFRVQRVAIAFAGLLVGCAALWVAMRNVRWSDVVTLAAGGDLRLALMGTLRYTASLFVRAWRWDLLLRELGQLRYRDAAAATFVGFAANYLLPARLGELVRVDYLKRITGTGRAASTGTVVVERTLDGLTVFIFIVIGILIFGLDRIETRPAFAVVARLLLTAALLFGGRFAVIMLSANFVSVWRTRREPSYGSFCEF